MTSNGTHKHYDVVEFSNGYGKHVPKKTFEYRGFKFGEGKEEWGAEPGKQYFVIKLGEKINVCYKSKEPCKHNCSGLCKESC